jgi:release factor H-coupled RctB family protein
VNELAQTPLGGRVVCDERDVLYEEALAACTSIEATMADLVVAGLGSVIATFVQSHLQDTQTETVTCGGR